MLQIGRPWAEKEWESGTEDLRTHSWRAQKHGIPPPAEEYAGSNNREQ